MVRIARSVRKEVTGGVWTVGDEGEDFRDEALLNARVLGMDLASGLGDGSSCLSYQLRIELCQPRLARIVEDQNGIDHVG